MPSSVSGVARRFQRSNAPTGSSLSARIQTSATTRMRCAFRRPREAYQALIQMEQQRPRRIKAVRAPDRSGHTGTMHAARGRPEPIRRGRPVNVIDDFETVSPSVGEILDHIAQNFFSFHQKSHGSRQRLSVEIVLDRREAFLGVSMPIEVPVYVRCSRCGGNGGDGARARYAMGMA